MATQTQIGASPSSAVPAWSTVLMVCAVVATAHLLGVSWLSESVLGLPAGVWVIALGTALSAARARVLIADAFGRLIGALDERSSTSDEPDNAARAPHDSWGWWPRSPVAGALLDACTRAAAAGSRVATLPIFEGEFAPLAEQRERAEGWFRSLPWPTRPLRVGLHMPNDEARALMDAPPTCPVRWFRLNDWSDPQATCRRHLLDAVVYHDGEGPLRIVTLERPGHPAGVVQWATETGPLSYAELFPHRSDPAAVVLEGATPERVTGCAALVRSVVESAAALSRSERRITGIDRALGRTPSDIARERWASGGWGSRRPHLAPIERMLSASAEHAPSWPEASALARQAASAILIGADADEAPERHRHLQDLAGVSPGEAACPALALRIGAACLGALDDDDGIAWLVRGEALLRHGDKPLAPIDHAAFLESELMHGTDDPMSVGRAAAGIAMVCAAIDSERLAFVRDDMFEEMAYARWLVGRDQDRSILMRVFREVERANAGDARAAA